MVTKTFGLLGRMDNQKGFDQAIRAFKAIPRTDLRLKIFGAGNALGALKDLAGKDPRIEFMGFCPDPVQAMAQIDILVMPSRWEAYGLVAQEALAAGRRVLVAPVDGLLDQIADGATPISGIGTTALTGDMNRLLTQENRPAIKDRTGFANASRGSLENGWTQLICDLIPSQPIKPHPIAA